MWESDFKSSAIEGSSSETFLSTTIDSNFTFENHINEVYKKGNLKLHALTICAKFMSTEKTRLIFKAFVIWQFNYSIQLLPIRVDVPYQTTKQSNQKSARKDRKK